MSYLEAGYLWWAMLTHWIYFPEQFDCGNGAHMLYSLTPYSFLSEGVQSIFFTRLKDARENMFWRRASTILKMYEYSSCDGTC